MVETDLRNDVAHDNKPDLDRAEPPNNSSEIVDAFFDKVQGSENSNPEVPRDEIGNITVELGELTDEQYGALLTELQTYVRTYVHQELEYSKKLTPENAPTEAKIEENLAHMETVRKKVVEYATDERGLFYHIDLETGDLISAPLHKDPTKSRPLLPVEVTVRRQAEIAAVLHDIEKFKNFQNEPSRLLWHHIWSAETVDTILDMAGFAKKDREIIKQAIEEHQAMPFVSDRLTDAKKEHPFWGKAGEAVSDFTVATYEDIEMAREDFKTRYDKDYAAFMEELELFPIDASPKQRDEFDAKWYELEVRKKMLSRMNERRPEDTVLAAEAIGLKSKDLMSPSERAIADSWEQGRYALPSNEVSALLYAADLMSPSEIVTYEAVEFALENGISTVEELYEADTEGIRLAAGSFDRYVGINLGWGDTLMESFESAYSSVSSNVRQIYDVAVEKINTKEGTEEEIRNNRRAGAILNVIHSGDATFSQFFIGSHVKDKLTSLYEEQKMREQDGELPAVITAYESDLATLRSAEDEIAKFNAGEIDAGSLEHIGLDMPALKDRIERLKPAYVQTSMFLVLKAGFEETIKRRSKNKE